MNSFLIECLVGLFATLGMLAFFEVLKRLKLISFDIVEAVGAFVSQKEKGSYVVGLIIHLFFGLIFGFIYIFAFALVPIPQAMRDIQFIYAILGLGLGFNHGMLSALVIASLFTQYHPLEKYRKVGFTTAVYFALGNIIYGLLIGFFFSLAR